MTQDQRHKDLDDAGHAPHAAAGHPEPGKQSLTAQATKDAAGGSAEIARLKKEVRDAYVGDGEFSNRGILDHKLEGVEYIKDQLDHEDQTVSSAYLQAALAIGTAAAAGALTATTFGAGTVAAALIAGSAAAAGSLPSFLAPISGPSPNANAFCTGYKTSLREKWPGSVQQLLGQMDTLDEARNTHRAVVAIRNKPDAIIKNQADEALDAWVNALKVASQKGTKSPADMGTEDFDDSTMGRLHIEGIQIEGLGDDRTTVDVEGLKAKLTGVPQRARDEMLDRKVGEISVARTIEGTGKVPPVNVVRNVPHFAFGVLPNRTRRKSITDQPAISHVVVFKEGETNAQARDELKRLDGAGTWEAGLVKIWERIRDRTLKSLGVVHVGN
ncbi:MAG TPA: hypothetical protein VFD36_03590 [Kofleriaceae bacterium]|nr:hypothetical protein [Kofleriaceae bacterium]